MKVKITRSRHTFYLGARGVRTPDLEEIMEPDDIKAMPPLVKRQQLEDAWRIRLESAQFHYQAAVLHSRKLLQAPPNGLSADSWVDLALAQGVEAGALAECIRVLRAFTELTVHNDVSEQPVDCVAEQRTDILNLNLISIVDDDESIRVAISTLLRSAGYEVKTFPSAELFIDSGVSRESACLIMDIRMPGLDGLALQRRLNAVNSKIPIIFISAHDNLANRKEAIEAGAVGFFRKPFEGEALLKSIEAAVKERAKSLAAASTKTS